MRIVPTQHTFLVALFVLATVTAGCSSPPPKRPEPTSWRERWANAPKSTVEPAPEDVLAFREVEFRVPLPRSVFVQEFLAAPLEVFIPGTTRLPGVHHTEPLTEARYPAVGSIRLVCLTDGNMAEERVLACDQDHLRYFVRSYTSPEAAPVSYAIGEFTFHDEGAETRVTWRYSFHLREDRFPGSLGWLGRKLFHVSFLDSDYAELMDGIVAATQQYAARKRLL
jgi:hypothetical protein